MNNNTLPGEIPSPFIRGETKMNSQLKLAAALSIALLGQTVCLPAFADNNKEVKTMDENILKTESDKISYAIGLDTYTAASKMVENPNFDLIIKAIQDSIAGKPLMTKAEIQQLQQDYARKMQSKFLEERKALAAKNTKEGADFLAKNKERKEVITTASGLQYEVLKEGTGAKPGASDTVTVHYRGTLLNGEEFDSSYARNEPASFPLNRVIKGWSEGVQLMKEGAKYKFYIPSNLSYGEACALTKISPNSTLIF